MKIRARRILAAAVVAALAGTAFADTPATTMFTYQGRLTTGGVGQTATYDFQFKLFDAASGGNQLGSTITQLATPVAQGLFTSNLDFGQQFKSSRRWLEIAVRPAGAGSYTTLTPRQEITAAPHAEGLVLPIDVSTTTPSGALSITNADGDAIIAHGGEDGISSFATDSNGNGIFARCDAGGSAYGVWGISTSGYGVVGAGNFGGGAFTGLVGARGAGLGVGATYGVLGVGQDAPVGVRGEASLGGQDSYGVFGVSTSTDGTGIRGQADAGALAYGVWGASNTGYGVFGAGLSFGGAFQGHTGVQGTSTQAGANGYGVWGIGGTGNVGVRGESSAGGSGSYGVYGVSTATNGTGVFGECSTGSSGYGVWGKSTTGEAGHFNGNVTVVGNLAKSGGSFKIDHPLDPANQFLYHSFVESPDMMNIYNGNITLDGNGAAVVVMPAWFEALNTEFRYQLTSMGAPSPSLYVASEMQNNSFVIAGGTPGARVSWMVTGIRHDAWANAHRIPVEEPKNAMERGRFLHPELYGLTEDASIDAIHTHPAPANTNDLGVARKSARPLPAAVEAPAPKSKE